MDVRLTWTDNDEAGDYVVPSVVSPRDLVSRPDNMDETALHTNEPRYEKTGFFAYAKTKTQTSFAVTVKLSSAFDFATRILQSLFYLNPKFQASSHIL